MELSTLCPPTQSPPEERIFKVVHPARRTLSPQEEKVKLMRKIEATVAKNRLLKDRQDSLQSTVPIPLCRSTT